MDEPTKDRADDVPELPPGVGPHELRERELLLAGEKPVAWFYDLDWFVEDIWADFADDVAAGRLIALMARHEEPPHVFFALAIGRPESQVQLLELFELMDDLHAGRRSWSEAADRRIGRLLGYSPTDIEVFLEWQRRSK